MKGLLLLSALALALAGCGDSGSAALEPRAGAIVGQLLDADGDPLQGEVSAYCTELAFIETDGKGRLVVEGLAHGQTRDLQASQPQSCFAQKNGVAEGSRITLRCGSF